MVLYGLSWPFSVLCGLFIVFDGLFMVFNGSAWPFLAVIDQNSFGLVLDVVFLLQFKD